MFRLRLGLYTGKFQSSLGMVHLQCINWVTTLASLAAMQEIKMFNLDEVLVI
jgi:hypothetical protein